MDSNAIIITEPDDFICHFSAQQDAVFELISMGFNVALWYTKYASRLAGKENITEDEAKEVHRSLKIAAGIFKHLKVQ